jgi:FlaG/FlaF family flagellin (archaellin)
MTDMGIDSLMSMELGMAVENTFQVKLSMMAITGGASVTSLAAHVVSSIQGTESNADAAVRQESLEVMAEQHGFTEEERERMAGTVGSDVSVPK